jgi:hypothetical protein
MFRWYLMSPRAKIVTAIAALFLTAVAVYFAVSVIRPSADELSGDTKTNAVIWGILRDSSGRPLSNILVRLGTQSAVSDADGRYIITTEEVGRFPIYFDGVDSSLMYQANDDEGAVMVINRLDQELNYTLTQLPGSVLSSDTAVVTPTPSSSPSTSPTSNPSTTTDGKCSLDSVKNLPATKENAIKYTYQLMLCREADAPGLGGWTGLVNSGQVAVSQLPLKFYQSSEFQTNNKISSLSNYDFVIFLYQKLLQREYDPGGLGHWVNLLEKNATREFVVTGFIDSDEFKQKHPIYSQAK